MSLTYRREIDGLRAIAVGAVVLFHAGLPVPAGFVGVDIFFVISGYLITALVLRENASTGRIDLADFYARRVRRIFPAVAVVLLAVVAFVPFLPEPARADVLGSAAAAGLFIANLFFSAQTSGYFTGDASQFPLLHLWSLSVEEQFYLVWPVLLIVLLRMGAPLRTVLVTLALGSFVLAEFVIRSNPSEAFYQMPARFWELAAGGLIAAMPARALPRLALWTGLALSVAACFVRLPHFPGAGALPAVAGAALVLAAIHGGGQNAVLASRPMVGIGLISYSLYLWHWPLLAIDRLTRVGESPLEVRLGLVALSVLLAVLSYRYVETPLRRPWRISSRATVAAGFAGMAMLCAGAWAWRSPGPAAAGSPDLTSVCRLHEPSRPTVVQRDRCSESPRVVIWGDSFAQAWAPMLPVVADGAPSGDLGRAACPPLLGTNHPHRSPMEAKSCAAWNAAAIAYIRETRPDTLILAGRWQYFIQPRMDGDQALARAVAAVAPSVRRILIVGPTPTLLDEPEKCAALGSDCAVSRADFEADAAATWRALRAIHEPKVQILRPADWLCDASACPGIRGGRALYADAAHVNPATAAELGRRVSLMQ